MKHKNKLNQLLNSMHGDQISIDILIDELGYDKGKNPVKPDSKWTMALYNGKGANSLTSNGVIAFTDIKDLKIESSTSQIRQLYKQVVDLNRELIPNFPVQIVGFVGEQRIVFFRFSNGNRDERLDINEDTVDKSLYIRHFKLLYSNQIKVNNDVLKGNSLSLDLQDIFSQELTDSFLLTVKFYRKKLSELITAKPELRKLLKPLLDDFAKNNMSNNHLNLLVQNNSYVSALGTVVDTIILRQLMRRFLEAYYGNKSFDELSNISLGIGNGTLDDAINQAVDVDSYAADETQLKKIANSSRPIVEEMNLFSPEEFRSTSKVRVNDKTSLIDSTEKARKQFKTVYSGDLFAGSVSNVVDKISNVMSENYTDFVAKLWVDTSSKHYSFRYEDLPPEALEKQYENSMSEAIQINIKDGKPIVSYGDDKETQKNRGAYYTDNSFVEYMINNTLSSKFSNYFHEAKKLKSQNNFELMDKSLNKILNIRVIDPSCGGGSFLRAAFNYLVNKHSLLVDLLSDVPNNIQEKHPIFMNNEADNEYQWEEYILYNMIYGIDIDYKALMIASLTLTLSSLKYHPKDKKLPSLIGSTLIHQNSLMNSVPFYKRKDIFSKYHKQIKGLMKFDVNSSSYKDAQYDLQKQLSEYVKPTLKDQILFLNVKSIEINIPNAFFDKNGNLLNNPGFDCVIGNPPWDKWKPNSDEFFSQYDNEYLSLNNKKLKTQRQLELFNDIPILKKKWEENKFQYTLGSNYYTDNNNFNYQSWKVDSKKTGGDLNLYIISLERFQQLLKFNGKMGVIVPDNTMTDKGTTGIRHMLFEHGKLEEFLSFQNKKNIFREVDSRYKFAALVWDKTNQSMDKEETFNTFFYKEDLNDLNDEQKKFHYQMSLIYKKGVLLSLTEARSTLELNLYNEISKCYSLLGESKLLKLGSDFHKSNDTNYFTNNKNDIPIYEGKSINQFEIIKDPIEFVSPESAMKKAGKGYKTWRLALRSVASSTNKRSLISSLLPPNSVSVNSINIQKDDALTMNIQDKLFYLGILNSYPIDFVLRLNISSNVNKFFLHQLPIPNPNNINTDIYNNIVLISKSLLQLSNKQSDIYKQLDKEIPDNKYSSLSKDELIGILNGIVGKLYNLSRDDMMNLLNTFKSPKHQKDVETDAQNIADYYDNNK